MLRYFFIGFTLLLLLLVSMTGLRGWKSKRPPLELFPDMVRQAKYKAQTESSFYADGRAAQAHATGTVPMGYSAPQAKFADSNSSSTDLAGPYKNIQFSGSPTYRETGRMGTQWGTGIPFEVTPSIMQRGQERYNISCAVCHAATGQGNGIASKYGLNGIANQHQQRIRDMADGEIFNTITWGKNTMMGYGSNIQVPDRWAIICYLRALQRSQNATLSDVPDAEQKKLNR
ncbi:MAG: cytochrome c [Verrucomicrobiae bacterium]|nr:cytochrome c [Verrucomicrobiae bacterium]